MFHRSTSSSIGFAWKISSNKLRLTESTEHMPTTMKGVVQLLMVEVHI